MIITRLKHVMNARRATVKRLKPFCSVSPAVAQCTFSSRNIIFPTRLVVLLFGETEFAINNTMWAALLTLLRNVESPKAGLLACSASTAWLDNCRKHSIEKLGSPAKASGALLGPKTCSKTVPFKLGLPSAGLSCFACSIAWLHNSVAVVVSETCSSSSCHVGCVKKRAEL